MCKGISTEYRFGDAVEKSRILPELLREASQLLKEASQPLREAFQPLRKATQPLREAIELLSRLIQPFLNKTPFIISPFLLQESHPELS